MAEDSRGDNGDHGDDGDRRDHRRRSATGRAQDSAAGHAQDSDPKERPEGHRAASAENTATGTAPSSPKTTPTGTAAGDAENSGVGDTESAAGNATDRLRPLTGPETLKALAHPLRLRILRRLATHGPATSTTLAAALGENTGTLSYHLRALERGGLVEDIPERSAGRERWWRGVRGLDIRRPPDSEATPAERAVADELDRMRSEEDLELTRRFLAEQAGSEGWMRGSRSLSHLTREELDEFHDAYLDLLRRFARGPEEASPEARPVLLRWFGMPAD